MQNHLWTFFINCICFLFFCIMLVFRNLKLKLGHVVVKNNCKIQYLAKIQLFSKHTMNTGSISFISKVRTGTLKRCDPWPRIIQNSSAEKLEFVPHYSNQFQSCAVLKKTDISIPTENSLVKYPFFPSHVLILFINRLKWKMRSRDM